MPGASLLPVRVTTTQIRPRVTRKLFDVSRQLTAGRVPTRLPACAVPGAAGRDDFRLRRKSSRPRRHRSGTRPAVSSRENIDEFPVTRGRFLRFVVTRTGNNEAPASTSWKSTAMTPRSIWLRLERPALHQSFRAMPFIRLRISTTANSAIPIAGSAPEGGGGGAGRVSATGRDEQDCLARIAPAFVRIDWLSVIGSKSPTTARNGCAWATNVADNCRIAGCRPSRRVAGLRHGVDSAAVCRLPAVGCRVRRQ